MRFKANDNAPVARKIKTLAEIVRELTEQLLKEVSENGSGSKHSEKGK